MQYQLFRSRRGRESLLTAALCQTLAEHAHESRRQISVGCRTGVAAGNRPQIGAGPNEIVGLSEDDPRALAVKTEALFRRCWNFQYVGVIGRRRVRDRQHPHDRMLPAFPKQHQNDGAGSVLNAFLAALAGFRFPEI